MSQVHLSAPPPQPSLDEDDLDKAAYLLASFVSFVIIEYAISWKALVHLSPSLRWFGFFVQGGCWQVMKAFASFFFQGVTPLFFPGGGARDIPTHLGLLTSHDPIYIGYQAGLAARSVQTDVIGHAVLIAVTRYGLPSPRSANPFPIFHIHFPKDLVGDIQLSMPGPATFFFRLWASIPIVISLGCIATGWVYRLWYTMAMKIIACFVAGYVTAWIATYTALYVREKPDDDDRWDQKALIVEQDLGITILLTGDPRAIRLVKSGYIKPVFRGPITRLFKIMSSFGLFISTFESVMPLGAWRWGKPFGILLWLIAQGASMVHTVITTIILKYIFPLALVTHVLGGTISRTDFSSREAAELAALLQLQAVPDGHQTPDEALDDVVWQYFLTFTEAQVGWILEQLRLSRNGHHGPVPVDPSVVGDIARIEAAWNSTFNVHWPGHGP